MEQNFTFKDGMLNVKHDMTKEDSMAVLQFISYVQREQTERIIEIVSIDTGSDEYREDLISRLRQLQEATEPEPIEE